MTGAENAGRPSEALALLQLKLATPGKDCSVYGRRLEQVLLETQLRHNQARSRELQQHYSAPATQPTLRQ